MARITRLRDPSLIRRAQQGDRRAFLALLNRYDGRLRVLAYGLLVDPRRVDAAMRIAYVKGWRDVVRIGPKDDAAAWLYRGVYNACIDELRREPHAVTARPPGLAGPGTRGDEDAATDVVDARDREALARRVTEALRSLSPEQRVAVVLVDLEGFSPEAAARIQGLTAGVLSARLDATRRRLAERVGVVDLAALDDRPAQETAEAATEPAGEAPEGGGEPAGAEPPAPLDAQSAWQVPSERVEPPVLGDEPKGEVPPDDGDEPARGEPAALDGPEPDAPPSAEPSAPVTPAAAPEDQGVSGPVDPEPGESQGVEREEVGPRGVEGEAGEDAERGEVEREGESGVEVLSERAGDGDRTTVNGDPTRGTRVP